MAKNLLLSILIFPFLNVKSQEINIEREFNYNGICLGSGVEKLTLMNILEKENYRFFARIFPFKYKYAVVDSPFVKYKDSIPKIYLNIDSNKLISSILFELEDVESIRAQMLSKFGKSSSEVDFYGFTGIARFTDWNFPDICFKLVSSGIINCIIIYNCKKQSI